LQKEIVRIVSGTTFNGLALLDTGTNANNTFVGTASFQVGVTRWRKCWCLSWSCCWWPLPFWATW
ncbi:MAG TPA: hypothetical protein VLL95_05840, partial [Phnomibacter sp.]|nr:hypothetical protein [Phnomibacter sp.]